MLLVKRDYGKYIPFLVIILTFPSIGQWMNIKIGETVYWWLTNMALLTCFVLYKRSYRRIIPNIPVPFRLFMSWVIIAAVYGCFMAQSYWDWKALINNLMIYLMPLSFYYVSIPQNLSNITSRWCRFAVIAFWFLLPFMQFEAPGKYMIPFSFLIIFWPYIKGKWRYIIFFFFATVFIFGTLGARSSILKYGVCLLLSFCFIFRRYLRARLLMFISYTFLFLPVALFVLGITGSFNVFKMDEYLNIGNIEVQSAYGKKGETESINADTRTFLYQETIASSIKHGYVLQGHSLARGYESEYFRNTDLTSRQRGERSASEVSILNIYTYMGMIGVCLYFAIFIGAVVNVQRHSRNYLLYVVACYVSFRWAFAWVEDFTRFDLNNLFLWAVISMCYSPYFLNLSNKQIKLWFMLFFADRSAHYVRRMPKTYRTIQQISE